MEGRPDVLTVLGFAMVPIPATGAPRRTEGGREAVCRFSRGGSGEGEKGRSEAGMEPVVLMSVENRQVARYGWMIIGMIGIGR